ncbi:hypothetical protein L7F22_038231 [Adiantum nelumboides]|nr:hypothetical protein [Adiantum nelumboides]
MGAAKVRLKLTERGGRGSSQRDSTSTTSNPAAKRQTKDATEDSVAGPPVLSTSTLVACRSAVYFRRESTELALLGRGVRSLVGELRP